MKVKQLEIWINHVLSLEKTAAGEMIILFPSSPVMIFGKLPIKLNLVKWRTGGHEGSNIRQLGMCKKYPETEQWEIRARHARIDGEIIVTQIDGKPSFALIVENMEVWNEWDCNNGIPRRWTEVATK